MKLYFLTFLLIILLAAGAGLYAVQKNVLQNIVSFSESTISTPGPLRHLLNTSGGTLTNDGVFSETNKQRQSNNLPALVRNSTLDQAAQNKLQDMADQQYFEHISPQGKGPADLAKSVMYEYLSIGENLALGNFDNDTDLVEAWMNSPGHRANILGKNYTEIGIATQQVTFEGRKTWLAVQEFGRPLSDCPSPASGLRKSFDTKKAQLDILNKQLDTESKNLENDPEKIDAYNQKVKQAQALQSELKKIADALNQQIRTYNSCLNQ